MPGERKPIPTGDKFGRLTVLNEVDSIGSKRRVRCRCDCGKEHVVTYSQVKNGNTKSCGCAVKEWARRLCLSRNTTHGMAGTRFHKTWKQMKKRATNPSQPDRAWYGESGVGLHPRWMEFENFRDDMYASYLEHVAEHGERKTTLDRISNNSGYLPSNVRWGTPRVQAINQSRVPKYEFDGRRLSLAEWAEIVPVDACTLKMRLRHGWSVERALTTPVKPSNRGRWDRAERKRRLAGEATAT